MNTKEAIEFLEFIKKDSDYTFENNGGSVLKKVIALLERGEKYEQMWGELCDRNVDDSDEYVYSWTEELFELMVNIQQKYFPKEESCSKIMKIE